MFRVVQMVHGHHDAAFVTILDSPPAPLFQPFSWSFDMRHPGWPARLLGDTVVTTHRQSMQDRTASCMDCP
jgi:hypothetical protein